MRFLDGSETVALHLRIDRFSSEPTLEPELLAVSQNLNTASKAMRWRNGYSETLRT
jgi:hypothetical protein